MTISHRALFIVVTLAVLSIVSFVMLSTIHAADCVSTYDSSTTAPAGYGASYNFFSTAQELLVKKSNCSATSFTVTMGSGGSQYVYKQGYRWTGANWTPFTLAGGALQGDAWYIGSASLDFSQLATQSGVFVVGYVCQKINGVWKCGCRDTACAVSAWQLQKVVATASGPVCGNNICESGETTISCAQDCHAIGPVCGNSTCESGETSASCAQDCGDGGDGGGAASAVSYTGPASISGVSNLTADVSQLTQPPRIVAVTWKLDGQAIGTDTTSPYSFDVNTALLTAGSHSMTVEAVDEDGKRTNSPAVSVTVGNGPTPTGSSPGASNAIVHLTGSQSGFTVGQGTRVYGDGPNTVVNGSVTLSTGSRLENVTVKGSITPASNARIQKVTLMPSGDGIDVRGRAEFSLQDSTLIGPSAGGSAKGISAFNDSSGHDISVIRTKISNFGGDGIAMYGPNDSTTGHARDVILDDDISGATGPYDNGTQARDILLGGDHAVIIGTHTSGATTDCIETYGAASNMRINHNTVANSNVGFYLEHYTDNSIFADNIVAPGINTGFNVEWLAGYNRTSKNVKFISNDVTYAESGVFADAGTTEQEVGPGNIFRGKLPAVTYQGSTNGSIHDNIACTPGSGNFAYVYTNAGFNPSGNVTQSNNKIMAPGSCPAAP